MQHLATLLPPFSMLTPGAPNDPPADGTSKGSTTTGTGILKRKRPVGSTSTVSIDDIGSMVDRLKIVETEDVLTIAGSQYSIPKMRAFFGKEMCWAHVATSKHGDAALTCCNHAGEPGHEPEGELHSCTISQREHIHFNIKDFRPVRPSGNGRP